MPNPLSHVTYAIDLTECRAHIFTVKMTIDGALLSQKLSLPVWTPGSYMVREFAQHIVTISAAEGERALSVKKINKNTFQLNNTSSSIVINYQVYGFDSSIRAAFIDDRQAFFNGTALFLRPHSLEEGGFTVTIVRPAEETLSSWQVASNMPRRSADRFGFGTYEALSYGELVDYPFQISEMKRLAFSAAGLSHEIVLVGDIRPFDEERLVNDLTALCENQIALFSGAAFFSSYLFIARLEEGSYGGLEHRNSSMLLSSPYCLPRPGMAEPDAHYRSFLGLCSHEYFHAWNVKRLKPDNFVNYDFDNECYTTMLWLFEGFTSYYDDLCLKRAGLISRDSYLELLGKNYGRLLKNPGRKLQSVAESSFDAWIKFYRQHENSLNTSTSYYLKGSFIGLYLDLTIRLESQNRVSLDDIMKEALARFGAGINEEQFFLLVKEIGGIDISDIRQKYIYGTEDLPLKDILSSFGIDCSFTKDELTIDDKTKMSAFLGIKIRFDENCRAIASFVEHHGPAMRAGLSPFDEIIAIDGHRLDVANAADLLASIRKEKSVEILYARKKAVGRCKVLPTELPMTGCKLSIKPHIEESERDNLTKWLGVI